ncbi:MAG: 16S rRNA (guanine(527)-N(7))-methyltransferase RsmG [Eubacterium sp.]|nr:16S rRNA (guanine(527)-N(7))-methyltransferase RsmG [Eubacterium sp.]
MKDINYYLEKMNINLSATQIEQLNKYMEMVLETNKVMNLTAITDPEEFALKHLADSLSIMAYVDSYKELSTSSISVIDVGTGAGFPGIPLKIACPDIRLTLLDSLNKRIVFLENVVSALRLSNVTTIHARAEEGARNPKLRDSFDLVVSRAVASMNVLVEYCLPYAKVGGNFVSYKSGEWQSEVEEAKKAIYVLGGKLVDTIESPLADSDIQRSFIVINKEKKTPKPYPRKPGTAKKAPL